MQTARRLRFLASLLFVFCVAVAITSPAQTIAKTNPPPDAEPEAPQHGNSRVRNLHVRLDGTATSENWSGYLVTGATGSVTDIKGSWIVPAVTCSSSGKAYSHFWVGIDGGSSDSSTVEQIGTGSDCVNGS